MLTYKIILEAETHLIGSEIRINGADRIFDTLFYIIENVEAQSPRKLGIMEDLITFNCFTFLNGANCGPR